MVLIRSFVYLDDYKLFSFSSQLFKGLTEHVVNFSSRTQGDERSREVSPGSARLVAEIASERSSVSEKRFLHDHAYNLFEQELESRGGIAGVSELSRLVDFQTSKFIKVSGSAVVNDAQALRDMVVRFNEIVDSLACVTSLGRKLEMQEAVRRASEEVKDRNELARLARQLKQFTPHNLSKEAGLRMDEEYMRRLAYLLEHGYGDQLQMQVPVKAADGELVFSAVLKRESLRESKEVLVQKYARLMEQRVTIVGIPTQAGAPVASLRMLDDVESTVKVVLNKAVSNMSEMESNFTGRMEREVVVDPVAIYVEVEVPGTLA